MSSQFYDRLVRCDILTSERYCTLPSDTYRLAFRDLVHLADDFGNLELNFFRILRTFQVCNSVNTKETLVDVLDKLIAADLIRTFQEQEKTWIHIPRHDNTRRYKTRKTPMSKWCDPNIRSDLEKRMGWPAGAQTNPELRHDSDGAVQQDQRVTDKSAADLRQIIGGSAHDLRLGVGVGVKQLQAAADPKPAPAPSHDPDPGQDQNQAETAVIPVSTGRGSRLPKNWAISEPQLLWALQYCQGLDIPATRGAVLRVADAFKDFWHSKPGSAGLKLDWNKTWQVWVRNESWSKYLGKDKQGGDAAQRMGRAI